MNASDAEGQLHHPITGNPTGFAKRSFYSTKLIGMEKVISGKADPDSYYSQNTIYAEAELYNTEAVDASVGDGPLRFENKLNINDLDPFSPPFLF